MDVSAVEAAAKRAASTVRSTGSPFLLECRTYRFRAHSMFDPELYRTKSEVEEWKKRDPITLLASKLTRDFLVTDADIDAVERQVADEVAEAVAFADAGTLEPVSDLTRFVYSERRST
jgi:TPP-dependent pyruvate/acetoin dehydrogenase alpha subunit